MTEQAIQNIYNRLLLWEGKRASQPYAIHKKLKSELFGYNDIYEWIADNFILNSESQVLDAGCGVGYGTLYLAKQFNCHITGISLSESEIEKATEFAQKESISNKVNFKQQSFDQLEPNSFDFIMAIESVKHTLDIKKTLTSLKNALKPDGTLIIVDDFLISKNNSSLIHKYANDWQLKVLLTQEQFLPKFRLKKDLTPYVSTKSHLLLSLGTLVLTLLKPVLKIATIMRGGFYLEMLFKRKSMAYYVLEFNKS